MIAIDLARLKACALFASTEETRYYLNGVCLQPVEGGLVYVATDGHKLLACRAETEEGSDNLSADIIIPLDVIAKIKLSKRGSNIASLAVLSDSYAPACRLDFEDGTSTGFKAIDGTFPAWRRVIPVTTDGETAQFNSRHLEACRKAGEILGLGEVPHVSHNGNGPALVRWAADDCFTVVMPHTTGGESRLPAWANPYPPAQDKAA